jgi:hypothetical protein
LPEADMPDREFRESLRPQVYDLNLIKTTVEVVEFVKKRSTAATDIEQRFFLCRMKKR